MKSPSHQLISTSFGPLSRIHKAFLTVCVCVCVCFFFWFQGFDDSSHNYEFLLISKTLGNSLYIFWHSTSIPNVPLLWAPIVPSFWNCMTHYHPLHPSPITTAFLPRQYPGANFPNNCVVRFCNAAILALIPQKNGFNDKENQRKSIKDMLGILAPHARTGGVLIIAQRRLSTLRHNI